MQINPIAEQPTTRGDMPFDCYSVLFNRQRTVFLIGDVEEENMTAIIAQLLYLDTLSNDEITIIINSPGGSVIAGLSLIDIMETIKSPIKTVCIGQACSMGALILLCGDKGRRVALPHARIMIHQISGGTYGQETDMRITLQEISYLRDRLDSIITQKTGQPKEKVQADTERDKYMSPEEALEYGIIDKIKEKANKG